MINEDLIESVINCFASETDSYSVNPLAKPAAIADAKVHPVPCVFTVSIRSTEKT